jgi:cytochrome P450
VNCLVTTFAMAPSVREAKVQEPFSPKRLRGLATAIRAHAEQLLRPDDPDRRIEFISEYATPLALAAIGEILRVPEDDHPLLERAVAGRSRSSAGPCATTRSPPSRRRSSSTSAQLGICSV